METAFALVILSGYVFGSRFGFLLGLISILSSAIISGGIGPWLPFQIIAAALVGAGAGAVPKTQSPKLRVLFLSIFAVFSSYFYGIFMTAWTWPLFVGPNTALSFVEGGSIAENLTRFIQFELVSGGLIWDTGRAVTTVLLIALTGTALMGILERAAIRPDFSKA